MHQSMPTHPNDIITLGHLASKEARLQELKQDLQDKRVLQDMQMPGMQLPRIQGLPF